MRCAVVLLSQRIEASAALSEPKPCGHKSNDLNRHVDPKPVRLGDRISLACQPPLLLLRKKHKDGSKLLKNTCNACKNIG
jgi:hypothetical protein